MTDRLIAPFAELCGALRGLHEQVEQLSRVHEAVDDFNSAFGAFQGAMALHASCLTFPKPPTSVDPPRGVNKSHNSLSKDKQPSPGTGIPLPNTKQVSPSGSTAQTKRNLGKTKAAETKKPMVRATGAQEKVKTTKPTTTGVKRNGRPAVNGPLNTRTKRRKTAMPKAGQPAWTWERHVREKIPRKYQSPAEMKKLENIVLYLKNRHCAISISDLVKHSGLPVIRCKEILQTLMKLDIIERKREKSGFVYSFGTSN